MDIEKMLFLPNNGLIVKILAQPIACWIGCDNG
jgi:hypothetical protein